MSVNPTKFSDALTRSSAGTAVRKSAGQEKGLVYVFTGEGKGKTSAALGVVVRALCNDMRVGWVSWYKEESWPISEKELPAKTRLAGKLEMYFMGEGFRLKPELGIKNSELKKTELKGGEQVVDKASEVEHKKAAEKALKKAESLLKKVDVLVMDEVVKAVADGLVEEKAVMRVVEKRDKTHVILTGRGPIGNSTSRLDLEGLGGEVTRSGLVSVADLVTECRKIKHPFDKGIKAVKGLDY